MTPADPCRCAGRRALLVHSRAMDAASRVAAARDVLSYLGQYRGRLFVLRIDDALRSAPLLSVLIGDVVQLQRMGIGIVLVAGARATIDRLLTESDPEPRPVAHLLHSGDRRVTPNEALPQVISATTDVVNDLVALLTESGARTVMGNWVRARSLGVIDGVDYQRSGRVDRVDQEALRAVLDADQIPVVSSVGWNRVGKAYNISSTELAVEISVAMGAAKLFFVSDRPGIAAIEPDALGLSTRPARDAVAIYSSVHIREAQQLLDQEADRLDPEERSLLQQAVTACGRGVHRVHIVDGGRDGVLIDEIFSADGTGTMLYADRYALIEGAVALDVPDIMRLLQPQMAAGLLVARSAAEIAETLEDYVVYRVDDTVQGCGALRMLDPDTAEIESLVIAESHRAEGSGRQLVDTLMAHAEQRGANRVVALTTQAADFFMALGFEDASPDSLPPDRARAYDRERNSRVLGRQLGPSGSA